MNLSPNILAKLDQPEQILDLDLDWQLVKQWEQEAFTHFPDLRAFSKLEGLSLSSHQISKLHKSFFPTSLERLDLSYNLLEHCKDFGFLPNLKSLDLSFNEVYDPKGLENLNTLEVLHLSHNQVENIRALDSLSRLRTLGLSGNRRIQDWKSISRLTSLKILYVKQLYGMTWDILEHLSDLEELYISFRRADKIPSFFTLKQLH
ncbi:MAG: leucine-rich repeat domain-containing protein, partial [Bacteroidota bacterium]